MDFRAGERRVALGTVLIGLAVFVLVAMTRVPWEPVLGGTPAAVPASSVFSRDEIDLAEHYARWARTWSWSALVVSLALACWLGFSRRGRSWAERVRVSSRASAYRRTSTMSVSVSHVDWLFSIS